MMSHETDQLIRRLASAGAQVRRLPPPWVRVAQWCALSLPYLLFIYFVWPKQHASTPSEGHFALEQVAAFTTGIAAALAAFVTVVPGYSKKVLIVPVVPLVLWLAMVGDSCVRDWTTAGPLSALFAHGACLLATVIAAALPVAVLITMLRRGAPLTPHLTIALATLAAVGLGNFGIRFVHTLDTGIVVLVWHVFAMFAISVGLAAAGNHFMSWRHTWTASDVVPPGA